MRPLPGSNAGGVAASFHVRPRSVERKTVGPEVPGARRGEQRPAVARIEHGMVDDVAEELRPRELPAAARRIARQRPQALAGRDQERRVARRPCGRCALALRCHGVPPDRASRLRYRVGDAAASASFRRSATTRGAAIPGLDAGLKSRRTLQFLSVIPTARSTHDDQGWRQAARGHAVGVHRSRGQRLHRRPQPVQGRGSHQGAEGRDLRAAGRVHADVLGEARAELPRRTATS